MLAPHQGFLRRQRCLLTRYEQEKNKQPYQLVQTIFSAHLTVEALRKIRDTLKFNILLIDKFDAVWQTDSIEHSGIYNLVHQEADFKIYVADEM